MNNEFPATIITRQGHTNLYNRLYEIFGLNTNFNFKLSSQPLMDKNRKSFNWRATDTSFDKAQLNQIELTVSDVYVRGRPLNRKTDSSSWISLLKERVSSVKKKLNDFWKNRTLTSAPQLDPGVCYFKAIKTPRNKVGKASPQKLNTEESIRFQPRLPIWQKRGYVHKKANFVNVLEYYKAVLVDRATEQMRNGRLPCTLNVVSCTVKPKPRYSHLDFTNEVQNIIPEPQGLELQEQNDSSLNSKRKRKDSTSRGKSKLDIGSSSRFYRQNKMFRETPDCSIILQNPDATQSVNIIEKDDDELAWLITQPTKKLVTNEKIMIKKHTPKIKLVKPTGYRRTKINPFEIKKLGREKVKPKLEEDKTFVDMKQKIQKAFENNIQQKDEESPRSEQMMVDSKMETDADEFGTGYSNDVEQEGYNFFKKPFSHLRRLAGQKSEKTQHESLNAKLPMKAEEEEKDDQLILSIVEEKPDQIQNPWQQIGNDFKEEDNNDNIPKWTKFTPEFPDLFTDKFFGNDEELKQKYTIFSQNTELFGLDENKWNNFRKIEPKDSFSTSLFMKDMNTTNTIKDRTSLKTTTQGVFTTIFNKLRGKSTASRTDENRIQDYTQTDKPTKKTKSYNMVESFNPTMQTYSTSENPYKDNKNQDKIVPDLMSLRFQMALESSKGQSLDLQENEYDIEAKENIDNKNLAVEFKSIDYPKENNNVKNWSLLQMLRFK